MAEVPRVNRSECCGCALCAYALPEVFRITPEGVSEAYAPENGTKNDIQKIIDNCPCMAILWFKKS